MEPFSPEFFDSLYEELKTMQVPLDADPILYGPKRLNDRMSLARNYASRCETIQLEISQELQRRKRSLRGLKTQYDLLFKDLLANDVDVRSGRNVADRNATATMKLKDRHTEIDELDSRVQDLEMFLMVVKTKRSDLKDIQSRIKDQKSLVSDEIGLGGRWGQQTAPIDPAKPRDLKGNETLDELKMIAYQVAGMSLDAAKELSRLTPEVIVEALDTDSPTELFTGEPTNSPIHRESVDALLEMVVENKSSEDTDDFSELLS